MSNYGFATYDSETQRIQGMVNSKFPIFGPRYNDIDKAFRTIHITDTYQSGFITSPNVHLPPAQRYQTIADQGVNRMLIATIPHGFKQRPLGYVTFSGSFVKNVRCRWEYTNAYDYYQYYAPSTTLTSTTTKDIDAISDASGNIMATAYTGDWSAFAQNYFSVSYPSPIIYFVRQAGIEIPGGNPYEVEIDDTNVYVYRNIYWIDSYVRDYYYYSEGQNLEWDFRSRAKGVVDFAGSSFDMTLYLCPYTMEELLT